jgi:hypothetical protein
MGAPLTAGAAPLGMTLNRAARGSHAAGWTSTGVPTLT